MPPQAESTAPAQPHEPARQATLPETPGAGPAAGEARHGQEAELIESLVTIWTEPRETIRRIVAVNPRFWVKRLAVLAGLEVGVNMWHRWPGQASPATLVAGLIVWPLLMIPMLYLVAWLIRITGRTLGGQAEAPALRAALAWAYVPLVAMLPLILVSTVLAPGGEPASRLATVVMLLIAVLSLAASSWTLVIECQGVAEVQGYASAWRGLGNVLLALLVVVAASVVVGVVLGVVVGIFGGLTGILA